MTAPVRRRAALAALALMLPAVLAAQALPDAKALLAKHEAAVGGRAAWDKHSSMHQVGTFALAAMQIEGPLNVYRAKPNKYFFSTSLGPIGDVQRGFDGTTAWMIQPQQGASIISGAEGEAMKRQADYFADLGDPTNFTALETQAQVDFEGKQAWKVRLVGRGGNEIFQYFDVETGLVSGATTAQETPMGRVEITQLFSEYKDFGGIKLPTKTVQRNPQFEITITISSVTFDAVDPAVFALPDAVKALVGK